MKNEKSMIVEFPQKTLFTRAEAAEILSIGLSSLDSLISDEELPRIRLSKRVLFARGDLEAYILAHRSTGGRKIPYPESAKIEVELPGGAA